jgi:mRNA-degrading endonuclease YafQ of YafQ-DinJ toxin-antitoxin module
MHKVLIQFFIPLSDNADRRFPGDWYQEISRQLKERFGGVTIYQRAPVTGLWKENEQHTMKDELIIYEVMADDMELAFWKPFKKQLEQQFRQENILIRSSRIEIL